MNVELMYKQYVELFLHRGDFDQHPSSIKWYFNQAKFLVILISVMRVVKNTYLLGFLDSFSCLAIANTQCAKSYQIPGVFNLLCKLQNNWITLYPMNRCTTRLCGQFW